MKTSFTIALLLISIIAIIACSTPQYTVHKPEEVESIEIHIQELLESTFEEVKALYGKPIKEDYLHIMVEGESVETTPYYRWRVNDYRLEIFYGEDLLPNKLRLVTEPLAQKNDFDFFDEINLDRPYIPLNLYDKSSYKWDGPEWTGLNNWSFWIANFTGEIQDGITTLVIELN